MPDPITSAACIFAAKGLIRETRGLVGETRGLVREVRGAMREARDLLKELREHCGPINVLPPPRRLVPVLEANGRKARARNDRPQR